MAMNTKEILLLIWIFVLVALSLLFWHFLGWTIYALQKIIALNVVSLWSAAGYAAVICAACLLS